MHCEYDGVNARVLDEMVWNKLLKLCLFCHQNTRVSLSAIKKDVTGYLYGGDITRKMKLREKQKKGKKKMQEMGNVNIPADVFVKMIKADE